ncbi:DUF2934 domain-containing protein [Azorhizobium caulinodans]|uniref:DUF2934 domain-containing protein n=1 Tax=Azorhizobium caulinodans (strain ATCC 43989 / DSM 5975 / JCM 20966 / LMG 6465 / NBRC 14845 / NCIMB 13405 / ORS 571) TaxID=438753 RepID=A8IJ48_AZOC5|nr:DUF2934 domain-containing protein [Azorhizobium caulinodans]BAF86247.1 hypothetical protein AZC_0249 [Azorhizobium caulinodans ORS 571]
MDAHDEKIRELAYQIWIEEGQPEGRAEIHWDMATELVAQTENYPATLRPVPTEDGPPEEPADIQNNLGEFPTLTDQGEQVPPSRKAVPED